MKIAIVNQHISDVIGGSELQCDFLAEGLVNKGHEVLYVAPSSKIEDKHNKIYRIHFVKKSATSILRSILAFKADVVYWRFNKHHFRAVAKGLHENEIPLVFAVAHINDLQPWSTKPSKGGMGTKVLLLLRRIKSRYNHSGFKYVTALTTLNEDFLKYSPLKNSFYVPNGMIEEYEAFNWPRPFVAWIANIKPAKRPEVFVDLARRLEPYGIDCLMAGKIQSPSYEWITVQKLSSNFHYLGVISPNQVSGLLRSSRLHVHTCEPEGFGNVFIQAWFQKTPSITLEFDPGGFLKSEKIGFCADGNMELFMTQAIALAADSQACLQKGEKSYVFAKEKFSVDVMVDRIEKVLNDSFVLVRGK